MRKVEERSGALIRSFARARRNTARFGLLLLTGSLALHCERDDSLSRVRDGGIIRIGYAVEAGYASVGPDGRVTGAFPELARRIAHRLGARRVEWRQAEFGSLIGELRAGRIDVIGAGMYITPEREALVAFSEPVVWVGLGLLVPRGNPRGLHSFADVAVRPGAKVAFLHGGVEEGLLRESGVSVERMVAVPDARAGRAAVEAGAADALALTAPTVRWLERENSLGRTEAARPFHPPPGALVKGSAWTAFAFRHRDRNLRHAWDRELRALFPTPEYAAILREFGFESVEIAKDGSE